MSSRPATTRKRPSRRSGARQRPEQVLQQHCVDIWTRSVPQGIEGPFWTAINPIPYKSKAVAGLSRSMGMRAGVWDWWILWRGRTIVIEFKDPKKGRLSGAQQDIKLEINANGGECYEVTTVDEFIALIHCLGIPCRAKIRR